MGCEPRAWYATQSGLFSERPHLYLSESSWHEARSAATVRHWVVDAATADVQRWAASYAAYTDDQYLEVLDAQGFSEARIQPTFGGIAHDGFQLLLATA